MNRIIAPLLAPVFLSGCVLGQRPDQILPLRQIPSVATNDIVVGVREGRLQDKGECLYLVQERQGRTIRYLVIWPLHTRFNGTAVVPGQSTTPVAFRVGEQVVVAGSPVDWAPHILAAYPQLAPWQQRCGAVPIFVASVSRAR